MMTSRALEKPEENGCALIKIIIDSCCSGRSSGADLRPGRAGLAEPQSILNAPQGDPWDR